MSYQQQPAVSVIIPSLNAIDYIDQCIESVLNQSLKDIEIICVDAGSDDGTLKKLKQYAREDSRLNVFYSNKRSYGSQMNQGLINARGKYVAIVETDDYIKKDMLESLYNLSQQGFVDIIKGNFCHVYDNEENIMYKVDTAKNALTTDIKFKLEQQPLFLEGHPSIWAGIYKRSFLLNKEISFYEEEGGAWVDNPFFIETALKADSIVYTNKPYYCYRETNIDSSTNNLKDLSIPAKRIKEMFEIFDKQQCSNRQIREMLYKRLVRYMEITVEKNNNESNNLDHETCKSLYEALSYMDFPYARENLTNKQKQLFYKFRSPLILSKFDE